MKGISVQMSELGQTYQNNEIIMNEGDIGDCMYVIQSGKAVVFRNNNGKEVQLGVLKEGDFFGEMAIFEREERSASVRALEEVRVLTVNKRTLMSRISEDPSMAFRMLQKLSQRIRGQNSVLTRIKGSDRRNWDTRPEQKE